MSKLIFLSKKVGFTPFNLLKVSKMILISMVTISSLVHSAESLYATNSPSKKIWSDSKKEKRAPLRPDWINKVASIMLDDKENDCSAWGLFSYGGWSDAGQIFIIKCHDKNRLYSSRPNENKIPSPHNLATFQIEKFQKSILDMSDLEDFENQVFDGVQFEFVSFLKDLEHQKVILTKRVFMNNPEIGDKGKNHLELVKLFTDLAKEFKPKG